MIPKSQPQSRPYSKINRRELRQQYSAGYTAKTGNKPKQQKHYNLYDVEAAKFFQLIQLHTNTIVERTYELYKDIQLKEQYLKMRNDKTTIELKEFVDKQLNSGHDIPQIDLPVSIQNLKDKLSLLKQMLERRSEQLQLHVKSKQLYEDAANCLNFQLKCSKDKQQKEIIYVQNDLDMLKHDIIVDKIYKQSDNKPFDYFGEQIGPKLTQLLQYHINDQYTKEIDSQQPYIEQMDTKALSDPYKKAITALQKSIIPVTISVSIRQIIEEQLLLENQLTLQQEQNIKLRLQTENAIQLIEQEQQLQQKHLHRVKEAKLAEIEKIRVKDFSHLSRVIDDKHQEILISLRYETFCDMLQLVLSKVKMTISFSRHNFQQIFMKMHYYIENLKDQLQQFDPNIVRTYRQQMIQNQFIPSPTKNEKQNEKHFKYNEIKIPQYLPIDGKNGGVLFKNYKAVTGPKKVTQDKKDKLVELRREEISNNMKSVFYK